MDVGSVLLGAAAPGTVLVAVTLWNRRNQRQDRAEDQATEVEREAHNRRVQRFARDYERAMELLDDVFRVASALRERPVTQAQLDGLGVPKLIRDLDLLGDKLEDQPDAKEQICRMWDRLNRVYGYPMHFDFPDGSDDSLYDRQIVLEYFVRPATIQVDEAVEILHHLNDCRSALGELWGPLDLVPAAS